MRRLVVCSDGSWNTPERKDGGVFAPSNVVKMARAILPEAPDGISQAVFYDEGVGAGNLIDRLTGGAFGIGLSKNVRDAYLSLIHNYAPGDEIFFFGFSRGAFTVRSAAGLIRKVGLLEKRNAGRAPEAWQLYRNRKGGPDSPDAIAFRESYAHWPAPITFIGVWDTVGALGIPGVFNFIGRRRFQFHDAALSRSVAYAYQALAIDEKRRSFKPTLWEQHPEATGQTLEQAWFPGVHSDIGGGYANSKLANDALLWMVEKAREAGLAFDTSYLKAEQEAASHLPVPHHESRKFPFTLIPAFYRPIGRGVPAEQSVYENGASHETLAPAARLRYADDPSYRPRNLVEYMDSHPTAG